MIPAGLAASGVGSLYIDDVDFIILFEKNTLRLKLDVFSMIKINKSRESLK